MKVILTRSMMVVGLLLSTAGCGPQRPLAQWVPGTYPYRSSLPGAGEVAGSIEIGLDGLMEVTSTLGSCDPVIETVPRQQRERIDGQLTGLNFLCGTDYRFSVRLKRDGGVPPIEGSISNERTEIVRYYAGPRTCLAFELSEAGDRVCTSWSASGWQTERRTTGATARWYVVVDSLAPQP
jgi:hypothetical protein